MMFIPRPIIPSRNSENESFYDGREIKSDHGMAEDPALILSRYAKDHGLEFKYHYNECSIGWEYTFKNPRTGWKWTYHIGARIELDCAMSPDMLAEEIISKMPKELF